MRAMGTENRERETESREARQRKAMIESLKVSAKKIDSLAEVLAQLNWKV